MWLINHGKVFIQVRYEKQYRYFPIEPSSSPSFTAMDPFSLATGIAGFAGLAGLFSTCLDIIDRVDSYKDFGVESRSIIAQFEADKLLFQKWAQNIGINQTKLKEDHHMDLDDPQTASIVEKILLSIQEIFSATDTTLSNLQPTREVDLRSQDGALRPRRHAEYQSVRTSASKRKRIRWALRGKVKFIAQVQQFGALVQRLYDLAPLDGTKKATNVHKGPLRDISGSLKGIDALICLYVNKSNQL